MPRFHHEDYHQAFFSHFETTLIDEGGDYATYEPYYIFGYDQALDEAFGSRTYEEAEPDLRRLFAQQYPRTNYDAVEEAVRFAYNHTRRNAQT